MIERVCRWMAAGVACLLVVACGGGGGSAGTSAFGAGAGSGTGGTGGGGSTSNTTTNYVVSVSLSNTTVTGSSPATVTAQVTNSSGVPQPNLVVSFTTAASRGALSAPSALTDASGNAVVVLSPANGVTTGADTLSASVPVADGKFATASVGFQLTATNVSIQSFTSDLTTLGAYGQTGLTVRLANANVGTPVTVALTSSCVTKGLATLTPATFTTTTGVATFTYRDSKGCGRFDAVDGLQASVVGTAATQSLQLALGRPDAASISFISATPQAIFLRDSGYVENSTVVFQVRDANGEGLPGMSVRLEPTTLAGGLKINDGSAPVTLPTDSEGKVLVRINSGSIPTPVRVKATLVGSSISTVSSSLAVAVGLPAQNNFSLSQNKINIEGYDIDGTPNTYTIIASDRMGNPVPDGTAINFVTESGQVQAIRETATTNGLSNAVANYQSSSPRPLDGRVTVLAYALGEESFLDANGNNVYDTGEDYQDLGDVFIDRLFNGTYNAAEDQFISPGSAGTAGIAGSDACRVATSSLLRLQADAPSRSLNQAGQSLSTCVSGWGRAYVRRAVQTVLSTSSARPLLGTSLPAGSMVPAGTSCPSPVRPSDGSSQGLIVGYAASDAPTRQNFYLLGSVALTGLPKAGVISFIVADNNPIAFNPMPAGTEVSVKATTGIAVEVVGGTPVPSTGTPTGASFSYSFDSTASSGVVTVSFKSPSGLISSFAQPIYYSIADTSGLTSCP